MSNTIGIFDVATGDYIERQATEDEASLNQLTNLRTLSEDVRSKRDALLAETDLWIIRASEIGEPIAEDKKIYRQALRDVPSQEGFPQNIIWPTKPE